MDHDIARRDFLKAAPAAAGILAAMVQAPTPELPDKDFPRRVRAVRAF